MKLLLIIAALLPVYLYSILSTVTITYDVTIAFTLISLLSLAIVGAIATLSKGSN
jgi:VIT1/CCC1 family predicted Fe2+/Mn2+ transporter